MAGAAATTARQAEEGRVRDSPARGLDDAARCLLAVAGGAGPLILPMTHWYDGQDVWMTTVSDSAGARLLADRPTCALCVPRGDTIVVATGEARVFGPGDPLGLALHAGPISGAVTALALRNAPALLGFARRAVFAPARLMPRSRVVIRVRIGDASVAAVPEVGSGVAPPLPPAVPADVRRALAGERRVIVVSGGEHPRVTPAVWDAGFTLYGPGGRALAVTGPVAVAVGAATPAAPGSEAQDLVLHGRVDSGRLAVRRASWWRGVEQQSADVPARPAGGVLLPD